MANFSKIGTGKTFSVRYEFCCKIFLMVLRQIILISSLCIFILAGEGGHTVYDRRSLGIINLNGESIPVNTTRANYNNNSISNVTGNIFINLPFLKTIDLSQNKINHVAGYAFANVSSVERIYLNRNNLEVVTNKMFKGLYDLKDLILYNNEIHTIERESFADISKLSWIDLSWNRLPMLLEMAFYPNGYSHLFILLHENPFFCDWRACWMKDERKPYNVILFIGGPRCAGPAKVYDEFLGDLTFDELRCK